MSLASKEVGEGSSLLGENSSRSPQHHYESLNCGMVDKDDNESNAPAVSTAKYWYRWYICAIFSLFGLSQGAVWNTWSPIEKSAGCALGFKSSEIDLLTNWGPISFLVSMPFVMWMLDRRGLRLPCVLSAFLVAVGTGLRCLPIPVNILRYFIHIGQMLNGIAGCAIMAAPPQLSNVWFPPEERVTATSLTTLFNYLGTGVAYIIGPQMVQQPWTNNAGNHSKPNDTELTKLCNNTREEHVIRMEIKNLMYVEFGVCMFVFLSMLAFFPRCPPKPPSASASIGRMDFVQGLRALLHRQTFLIVTVTFALTLGGYGGWTGVLTVILDDLKVSQDEAGRLGFFMTLAGCFVGMFVGWFADRFKGHIKLMIIVLFSIAFFGYLYYVNMSLGWVKINGFKFSHVGLWVDCIVIGIAMNAAVPLGMEMGADAAYPTSEAISASVIVWFFNLLSFIILLVMQFTDAKLTNYLMLAFTGVSVPLMIFFTKEPGNRLQIDMSVSTEGKRKDREPLLDPNINVTDPVIPYTPNGLIP